MWDSDCMGRLRQLEQIHRDARGTRRGRRWDTEQLNRSLFVALVGQFQDYCRELHDEAISVFLSQVSAAQRHTIGNLLRQGRGLDRWTPRKGVLISDFGRLGAKIVPALQNLYGRADRDLNRLELLIGFRNAIVHGNESELDALVRGQRISATLNSYSLFKRTIDRLVGRLDTAVATELAAELQIGRPW